jgi:hypothetical protein
MSLANRSPPSICRQASRGLADWFAGRRSRKQGRQQRAAGSSRPPLQWLLPHRASSLFQAHLDLALLENGCVAGLLEENNDCTGWVGGSGAVKGVFACSRNTCIPVSSPCDAARLQQGPASCVRLLFRHCWKLMLPVAVWE